MRRVLWVLPVAAFLAGCVFGECDFGSVAEIEGSGVLTADASTVGDTLTIAFVSNLQAYDVPLLEARGPFEFTPDRAVGTQLELAYQLDGIDPDEEARIAPPLTSTLRGDTLYVYVEGALSPDLFTEACSPPMFYLAVFIDSFRAPESVRAVRLTHTYIDELVPEASTALRRADAERTRPVLFASSRPRVRARFQAQGSEPIELA